MSEQRKHTPGPWRVAPPYLYGTGEGIHVDAGARSYIAHVGERGDAQSEADARLIAAAPELYVALKETAHALGLLVLASGDFCVLNAKAIDAANAALVKAEGRA